MPNPNKPKLSPERIEQIMNQTDAIQALAGHESRDPAAREISRRYLADEIAEAEAIAALKANIWR